MGNAYSVAKNTIIAGPSPQTLINLFSVAGVTRAYIDNIIFSSGATPDDQANDFEVMRTTGLGTELGGIAPVKLDPDTPASAFDAGYGYSAEPTETTNSQMLAFGLNQRATFSWLANPGSEIVCPAVTSNGVSVVRRLGTGLYTLNCTILYKE